jgi:hypothetical protein
MLRFFYRLKRRGGVVLFAVIAIMTLMIAMATTAYLTARASYQTVVSNYDFSQTYLSAISISDMLIEAVTQDTSHPEVNKFGDLKTAVQNLRDNKTPNTDGAKITGYTKHGGAAATDANILEKAASDPVEAGIFDAAKVEIAYVKCEADKDSLGNETGLKRHYFTFTTTVYYRDTTITVQDTVLNKSGTESKSDPNPFSKFFTATTQTAGGKDLSRVVFVDANEISDDTYFENDYTVIGQVSHSAANVFKGSLISSGTVLLGKTKIDVPATSTSAGEGNRNDWFIGQDLIITSNTDQNFDLKGSNIYIGGDLIIQQSGCNITCANLFVKGNIYYLQDASGTINGNVYLGGDVIYNKSEPEGDLNTLKGLIAGQGYTADSLGVTYTNGTPGRLSYTKAGGWDDTMIVPTSVKEIKDDNYVEMVKTDTTLGDAMSEKIVRYNYDAYHAGDDTYKNQLDLHTEIMSMDMSNLLTVDELLDASDWRTGGSGVYDGNFYDSSVPPYGANVSIHLEVVGGKVEYTKTLQSDGTVLDSGEYSTSGSTYVFNYDDGGTASYNKSTSTLTVTASNGEGGAGVGGATLTKAADGRVTVDIEYTKTGYLLDVGNGNGGLITYNFETKQKGSDESTTGAMPIALKANFNDGTGTPADADGNNAFSWSGNAAGRSDSKKTIVQLLKDGSDFGDIAFEVASYKNVAADGATPDYKYTAYSVKSDSKYAVPTYYEGEGLIVGTEKQVDYLKDRDLANSANLEGMLGTSPYAASGYENHIMLISNKNGGRAVDGSVKGHVLCGYIYAPNGSYYAHPSSKSYPVFGGIIVSVYDTSESYFTYCSPNPSLIKDILDSLVKEDNGGTETPAAGVWYMLEGKNYLG